MTKTKTTKKRPKLLVIRPFRSACRDFYLKFREFDVSYLTVGDYLDTRTIKRENPSFRLINTSYSPEFLFAKNFENLSWVFMKRMEEEVKRTDIVCISDNYYFFNLQAVILAKKYNKKVVTILWATIPNHISSWFFPYSFITKKVIALTDLFILRNKSSLVFAKSLGISGKKITTIYKGIDLIRFYPVKRTTKKDKYEKDKIINILYVGRLEKSKGLNILVSAFEKLSLEYKNIKLTLAGGGSLTSSIEKKIKNGLSIDLLGFVDYRRLPEVYRGADIFCSPSAEICLMGIKIWEEYFSYTLMEAQASGLPIVTTRSTGVIEEVDPRNLFVKKTDINDLYFKLKRLIENTELRSRLGRLNRQRAEELFNSEIQAKKTEKAILKIYAQKGS